MATEKEVQLIIGHLGLATRTEVDMATVWAYAPLLADIPGEELAEAARRLAMTSRFFPSVADLRQEWAQQLTGNLPEGDEAWSEVKEAIRKVGFYGVPQFSSPVLTRAVAAIGWEALCSMDVNENSIYRAQFVKTYDTMRKRQIHDTQVASLPQGSALKELEKSSVKMLGADKPSPGSGK